MSTDVNDALGISQPADPNRDTIRPEKYDQLKKISGLMTIFAWITGSVVLLAGLIIAINTRPRYGYRGDSGQGILMFLLYAYMGAFIVISLLAQAGIIKVLIDIEKNTGKFSN